MPDREVILLFEGRLVWIELCADASTTNTSQIMASFLWYHPYREEPGGDVPVWIEYQSASRAYAGLGEPPER